MSNILAALGTAVAVLVPVLVVMVAASIAVVRRGEKSSHH